MVSYLTFFRLTTYLDCSRVFTWLAYFGYMHGELESHLSTAVTGKEFLRTRLLVVGWYQLEGKRFSA